MSQMNQLKAEAKKLLTVRSTYFLTLLVWVALAAIAFFGVGYHDTAAELQNPLLVQNSIFGSLRFAGLISAIVAILLLAHEYRYNTINFSFTLNPSRSSVLAAKFVVLTGYSIILSLVSVGIVIGCLHAGAAAHGHMIGTQAYTVISGNGYLPGLLLQSVFYVWAMALAGLIVTALLRNLVASIAFIFIFPGLENLVSLISKTLVNYLPFSDLGAVLKVDTRELGFSAGKSMIIFLIYLAVFGFISWWLFLKRDAN